MDKDVIYRQDAIDALMEIMDRPNHADFLYTDEICKTLNELPSAQPEPDWDYSKETKQITLIVPEDVYDSAETIFLSVGYEGTFGIRGMVYSVQPSSSCAHENDSISRRAAIDAVKKHYRAHDNDLLELIAFDIERLPFAQPKRETGEWIEEDDEMRVRCSKCGEPNDFISDFCPNCGADMRR